MRLEPDRGGAHAPVVVEHDRGLGDIVAQAYEAYAPHLDGSARPLALKRADESCALDDLVVHPRRDPPGELRRRAFAA
jgi:hypothetical protein